MSIWRRSVSATSCPVLFAAALASCDLGDETEPQAPPSVVVTPAAIALRLGDSATVGVTVTSPGYAATARWTASDPAVVVVAAADTGWRPVMGSGQVRLRAAGVGTARIELLVVAGGYTVPKVVPVTVTAAP